MALPTPNPSVWRMVTDTCVDAFEAFSNVESVDPSSITIAWSTMEGNVCNTR